MLKTMATIAFTNPGLAVSTALGALNVTDIVDKAQQQGEVSATKGLETKAQELGGGAWRILLIIGAVLVLIGLGIAGLKLFFSNSSTRTEAKGDILWKLIGAIFFFGVGALVIVLFNVGNGLFTTTTTP